MKIVVLAGGTGGARLAAGFHSLLAPGDLTVIANTADDDEFWGLLVCPDVDPKVTVIAIMGQVNWVYQWYRPGGERSIEELAQAFSDFVVAGIACSPQTHVPGHRSALHPLPADFVALA